MTSTQPATVRRIVLEALEASNDAAPLLDLQRLVNDRIDADTETINEAIDELERRGEVYIVNGTVKRP